MASARQKSVTKPTNFYRKLYPIVMSILVGAIALILVLVSILLYQVSHPPVPQFNAFSPNGKSIGLTAFDEPNYLPTTLTRWASKAAVAAYTFDFVNYNKQIDAARPYFTDSGWAGYRDSVSSLVQSIVQKQIFVNGVVSGAPVISNQGPLPGKGYSWRMQMPFLVTFQSSEATEHQDFFVIMTIVKVPTSVDPTGIGIDQFLMK